MRIYTDHAPAENKANSLDHDTDAGADSLCGLRVRLRTDTMDDIGTGAGQEVGRIVTIGGTAVRRRE